MKNKHYQVFLENAFKLVQSLVIKSDYTAQSINNKIYLDYGEGHYDEDDRRTWRYYLNLAGEYHRTNTMIRVESFDTRTTIDFTKNNLLVHASTRNEYRFGTTLHRELISLYPDQEDLIRGILNPVNLDKAIAAKDFTILNHSSEFVEYNEYSLMSGLQQFISQHSSRFYNQQFNISEDLYTAAYLSNLMMHCIMFVIVHRKRMSKTSEAHSFHVMQYLNSHSKVGEYYALLNHDQRMFFMRNIRYIERNIGKKETFDWLRENLLDAIGLPLTGVDLKHDLSYMPGSIRPVITFSKTPLNNMERDDSSSGYTFTEFMDKTDNLASLNRLIRLVDGDRIQRKAQYSIRNSVRTKVLESQAISNINKERYTLDDILISNWSYLANKGVYDTPINLLLQNERVGRSMSPMDAFYLFIYSYSYSLGLVLEDLPEIISLRARNIIAPTFTKLRAMLPVDHVSDEEIEKTIIAMPAVPTNIYTSLTFMNYCQDLYAVANQQRLTASLTEDTHKRGSLLVLAGAFWTDYTCIVPKKSYNTWFAENGFDRNSLTDDDLNNIWRTIYKTITGVDSDNSIDLANIQKAMIRLMSILSSYSVRYIGSVKGASNMNAQPSSLRLSARAIIPSIEQLRRYKMEIARINITSGKLSYTGRSRLELSKTNMCFNAHEFEQYRTYVTMELPKITITPRGFDIAARTQSSMSAINVVSDQ